MIKLRIIKYNQIKYNQIKSNKMNVFEASDMGDIDRVKFLVESENVDVNAVNKYGYTALAFASMNSNENIVRYLLSKDANINVRDVEDGFTPLNLASFNGQIDMIKLFIDNGADVNVKDNCGNTPLYNAVFCRFVMEDMSFIQRYDKVINLLVDSGADVRCLVCILYKIENSDLEFKVINTMDISELYNSLQYSVWVEHIESKIAKIWNPLYKKIDSVYPNYQMDDIYDKIRSFLC